MIHFSTGDGIAIAFGTAGLLKWGWDTMRTSRTKSEKHTDGIEGKLIQLSSDFGAHKAEDHTELKWIKEALVRIERQVGSLQRQMGFLATHSNDQIIHMKGEAK